MAKIIINEELCKGCGLCTTVCPKQILELSKDKLNSKGYHPAYQLRQGSQNVIFVVSQTSWTTYN